jgi:hypothetical protein
MKLKTTVLLLAISNSAFAEFGEKVNCRQEVLGTQSIYAGPSSCNANLVYVNYKKRNPNDNLCFDTEVINKSIPITQQVQSSTSPVKEISALHRYKTTGITTTGPNNSCTELWEQKWLSCFADIPYSHEEDVQGEVCDYKPIVSVSAVTVRTGSNEFFTTVFSNNSDDYDGEVVSTELWVNGQKFNSKTANITTVRAANIDVVSVVTDNDGYQTQATGQFKAFDETNSDPINRR